LKSKFKVFLNDGLTGKPENLAAEKSIGGHRPHAHGRGNLSLLDV